MAEDNFGLSAEEKYYKNLQKKVLNGEASEGEKQDLIEEGQDGNHFRLAIDRRDKPNNVVTVIQESSESTHVADFYSCKMIVEGECKHCGSNRLKKAVKEPQGIQCISCPVCNRDNMSSRYEFEYELGGER